jgi:hypothetical protein
MCARGAVRVETTSTEGADVTTFDVPAFALGVEPVHRETLAAVDVHHRFAEHCPGPVVITSDGGVLAGTSSDDSGDEETTHRYTHIDDTRREHGERHGYSTAPARDGPTNPELDEGGQ